MEVRNVDAAQKVDIDEIISKIREHEDVKCPKCGEKLYYQANADLSKIQYASNTIKSVIKDIAISTTANVLAQHIDQIISLITSLMQL